MLTCRERGEPVPPWYLPTAMTCFVGFTYGNASWGEVRGSFISPPSHKAADWHPGFPATVKGNNSTVCASPMLQFSNLVQLILSLVAQFNQCDNTYFIRNTPKGQLVSVYNATKSWCFNQEKINNYMLLMWSSSSREHLDGISSNVIQLWFCVSKQ